MEDLAPQLGGILVGDASGDESGPQGTLDPGGISVPVTLVLSSSLPEQADLESQSSTMLNTLALHTGDGAPPTTQFFLEQCADGRTRLKTAEGHILEVDIDPGTFGLVQGNSGLPVLLQCGYNACFQVSTDSTLVHRDSVQIAVTASGTGAAHVTRSTEEQRKKHGSNVAACDETEEPMFRDLCKECVENSEPFDGQQLPLQMYLQVGKETVDENSTPLEDGGQANTSTAVAIVTPDGDESDADELPTPNVVQRVERVERLEDFMDVVTTYHCKFCSFSCAWRSGVMSHFRSCHVAPSGSGCLDPIEPPVNSSHKIRPGTKVSRTGSSAVAFALTTAVDSSAAELVLKAPVEPPEPPPRVPASMPVSEVASKPTSDTVPSRVPMDASLVLENALASMASTGSSEVLPSSSFSKSTGEGGQQVPAQERHIFICGQCSQGFGSLDDCKEHMVEAHDLKVGADPDAEAKKGTTTRKRGRPRCTAHLSESPSGTASVTTTGSDVIAGALQSVDDRDLEDGSNEALGKRRVRPPKNLEDDYLVAPVRRRRAKKENAAERQYRCGERSCGYRFRTEQSLEYHVRCHTPTASRPYCCPECGEQRDHWRSLAMHLWRSHLLDLDLHRPSAANHVGEQTNQRPLYTDGLRVTHVEPSEPSTKPCTQCNYRTFSAFKLENHARIHSEERDFTCAQCGKGFKQLSQLRNHHVVHLDRKNTPHKRWYSQQTCELCQRTFSDSKCLRKHHQAVHGKVKPYVCSFCGHMSARKAMLQLHLRQHTGEKPFACNLCEYRTGDHNSLRRHKMRHSGTKPYKCPHCPYACIQAISYKMHMKNKHPGLDGLYACSLCSFRSVSKENYTNHMSDHKRGFLAVPGQLSSSSAANSSASTEGEGLQLPEGTLQQLEGILPGNLNAAQLIYSCLSALQQEGGTANLPPGVTTYSTGDGTQTITIQVPSTAAGEDSGSSLLPTPSEQDQFYLTVQQQEDGSMAYLSGEGFAQGADVDSDVAGLKISAVHFTESR